MSVLPGSMSSGRPGVTDSSRTIRVEVSAAELFSLRGRPRGGPLPPEPQDEDLDLARRRVSSMRFVIGACILLQSLACFVVATLDLFSLPDTATDSMKKMMDFTFTLESVTAIVMFIFSMTWFC